MKKNKLLVAGLATALLFTVNTVSAKEVTIENQTGTGEVTVKYGVSGGYTLVIPDDVTFTSATNINSSVEATDVIIETGKKLQITVSSLNNWNLKHATANSNIPYLLKSGTETLANDSIVLEVESGTVTGSSNLVFSTTSENIAQATASGEHTDKITFSASVVNQ